MTFQVQQKIQDPLAGHIGQRQTIYPAMLLCSQMFKEQPQRVPIGTDGVRACSTSLYQVLLEERLDQS